MTTPFQLTQSFVPTQIPGCQLWFDAADQTTLTYSSGTSVSQWQDKSRNAYSVIQPTASNQPTVTQFAQNRLPGLQFSQSTYLYQTATSMPAFTTGGSTSVLMAARNADNNNSWNIINTVWFDTGAASATQRYHFSFNQVTTAGTTLYTNGSLVGQVTSNAVAPSSNAILGFTASATSQTIHTNGSTNSYPGVTLPDATGNTDFIFNDARNNIASANTMVFEMVGYNTQISVAQRQQLEGYLAWKWGMVANLPADHPYKTTSILSLPPFPNAPRLKYATQATLFQPIQVSGCTVWLDGADPNGNGIIPANGSSVASWVDKSSNGMSVSAASSQPTYSRGIQNGLGAVTYNGSQNLTTGNVLASKFAGNTVNLTLFCVFSFSNTVTGSTYASPFCWANAGDVPRIALSAGNNADGVMMDVGSNVIGRTTFSVPPPTFDNTFYFISYFKNGVNTQLNLNGSNKATTSNQATTQFGSSSYAFNVGNGYANSAYFMRGNVGEILFYNSTLSTQNFQLVEGYLAWKWGLQASLPSSHPYKNAPVYSLQPFPVVPRIPYMTTKYFNPNSIAGCSLWLDAGDSSTVTLSNGTVTGLLDKSTSNVTLSNSSGYTYPNNTFNGTRPSFFVSGGGNSGSGTQRLGVNSAFALTSPFSVSFVCQHVGAANYGYILDSGPSGSGRPYLLDSSAGPRFETPFGSGGLITTSPLFNTIIFGSNAVAFQNGTQQLTGSASFTTGGITIGNRYTLNESWPGHICEMILHNTALTTFQRQQVEGYLAWKWGLQGNLPANHPYKLFPPAP
jgi:hypothetical protein